MNAPTRAFHNALTAHQQGDVQRAERLYRGILKRSPRHAGALTQLGLIAQTTDRKSEARELLEKAARVEPENPSVRNGLGQLYLSETDVAAAEVEFRAAVAADPGYAPAWHNLGIVQASARRYDEAIESFRRALAENPNDAQGLYNLGQSLGENGDFDAAIEVLGKAIRQQPAVPQIRVALGDVLIHAGDPEKAIHQYREVERLVPGNPVGAHRIGTASQQIGNMAEAITAFERARALSGGDPTVLCELANAHALAGAPARALALFAEAADTANGDASLLAMAARGQITCGDTAAARDLMAPLIAARNGTPEVAIAAAELAEDQEALMLAQNLLETALSVPDLAPLRRLDTLFTLARVNHRRGNHGAALEQAREANRLKNARFDAAAEAAVAAHVIGADLANAKNNAPTGPELIFVVGMQRAGLRLVEAILCAHPDVASVGPAGVLHATANTLGGGGFGYLECIDDDDRLDAAAAAHMEAVGRRTGAARVAVEAVPGNIFHLALVNRLFADAKIVLCRRNPIDTRLSCFFEDFAGASPYAYDLDDLADHADTVATLADHWRSLWGDALIETDFEALIEATETAARPVFDALGLTWSDACAQVVDSGRPAWRECHTDYESLLRLQNS